MFAAAMESTYFREMQLRRESNDPRCTLFYTYQPPPVAFAAGCGGCGGIGAPLRRGARAGREGTAEAGGCARGTRVMGRGGDVGTRMM